MPQYFLLTSLAMAVSALCIAALVPRFPRGSFPLFGFSPALALYVNLNWDMWGVLLMVVALLLFVRGRDDLAAAVLAAAAWTKFFRSCSCLSCCWTDCSATGGARRCV